MRLQVARELQNGSLLQQKVDPSNSSVFFFFVVQWRRSPNEGLQGSIFLTSTQRRIYHQRIGFDLLMLYFDAPNDPDERAPEIDAGLFCLEDSLNLDIWFWHDIIHWSRWTLPTTMITNTTEKNWKELHICSRNSLSKKSNCSTWFDPKLGLRQQAIQVAESLPGSVEGGSEIVGKANDVILAAGVRVQCCTDAWWKETLQSSRFQHRRDRGSIYSETMELHCCIVGD